VFPGRMTKPDPAQISRAQARDSQSTTASACAQVIGSERDSEKRRIDYFKRLMCKGEVSKAFRAIVSDAKVLPYSPDGLTFLQSKHPALPSSSVPWDSDSGDRMESQSQRPRLCRRRSSAQRSAIGSSFRIPSSLHIRPARVARTSTATVFTPRSAARMVT